MRYGAEVRVEFSITVDPDEFLAPGLRERWVNIPVEFTYFLPDKANPSEKIRYYLTTIILQFELIIPGETVV